MSDWGRGFLVGVLCGVLAALVGAVLFAEIWSRAYDAGKASVQVEVPADGR